MQKDRTRRVTRDCILIPRNEWQVVEIQSPAYIVPLGWGEHSADEFEAELNELLLKYKLVDPSFERLLKI